MVTKDPRLTDLAPSSMGRPKGDTEGDYEPDYQRLVERCPDIIYRMRIRPTVRIDYINSAAERIWSYPREEIVGAGLDFIQSLLVDEQDRTEVQDVAAGRRYYPAPIRRYQRGDGTTVWLEIHNVPVYDESGALIAQEGTIRDVTDREEAFAALGHDLERYRHFAHFIPDLVVRVNADSTILPSVKTGSRQPTEAFVGRSLADVLRPEYRSGALRALAQAYSGTAQSFLAVVDILGEGRSYEFRLIPVTGEGVLAILRDVTDDVQVTEASGRQPSSPPPPPEREVGIRNPYKLTFREFSVLHLVALGTSDKEIAAELSIAQSTVNKHVSNILAKMGATSRTEAGVRAAREGVIPRL